MNRKTIPEYAVWCTMRARCRCKTSQQFKNYGARGIGICAAWDDFWQFYQDMGPRPSPKHSLDRREVDGNYEPDNCRWSIQIEQVRNTRVQKREDVGVRYSGKLKGWTASIAVMRVRRHLGLFDTKDAAIAARADGKARYWQNGRDIREDRERQVYRNNASGVPGVYFIKAGGKWGAFGNSLGKRIHLGRFTSFDAAKQARANFVNQQRLST